VDAVRLRPTRLRSAALNACGCKTNHTAAATACGWRPCSCWRLLVLVALHRSLRPSASAQAPEPAPLGGGGGLRYRGDCTCTDRLYRGQSSRLHRNDRHVGAQSHDHHAGVAFGAAPQRDRFSTAVAARQRAEDAVTVSETMAEPASVLRPGYAYRCGAQSILHPCDVFDGYLVAASLNGTHDDPLTVLEP
jgi:hypothetical protein